jgi:dTDP-4-dehydrorhamnose reductase
MKLLIIGGRGLLGQLVQREFNKYNIFDISAPTSQEVDFSKANN